MAFSGALQLTDLNDYLGPSQACIKPVSGKDAPSESNKVLTAEEQKAAASTEIAIDHDGTYYESAQRQQQESGPSAPRERTRLETAEISLNDCLACSGCVTSAESVLIGLQSVEELRKAAAIKGTAEEQAPTHLIASISPQSLASLSAKYSPSLADPLSLQRILARIEEFLTSRMQFDIVTDTSFARHLSLMEQAREYKERRAASSTSPVPTLPMLASACPGWICYAEKTHGELIPLISKMRSPQQMAGLLAKQYLVQGDDRLPKRIYHVTVMPCYDKKLEASRQDFFDDITQTRDVDLVITTGELETLMLEEGFPIVSAAPALDAMDVDAPVTPPTSEDGRSGRDIATLPRLLEHAGSSSGSYLFDLMQRAWLEEVATNQQVSQPPRISVKVVRSVDHTEYILRSSVDPGKILFKGVQCFGFRNLQNLVRKVQRQTGLRSKKAAAIEQSSVPGARRGGAMLRGRGQGGMVRRGRGGAAARPSPLHSGVSAPVVEDDEERAYDFVEVMACPGGCVNGGGQLRPPGKAAGDAGSSALTSRTIAADVTEAILDSVSKTAIEDGTDSRTKSHVVSLDAEGFTPGWTTPPQSIIGSLDELSSGAQTPLSGMGDIGTDEAVVQGWKGTDREWVRRVEYMYWRARRAGSDESSDAAIGSVHQAQALGVPRDQIEPSISQAVAASRLRATDQARLDALADDIMGAIYDNKKAAASAAKAKDNAMSDDHDATSHAQLFRTEYRALQDEAVSGLAVQW